MAAPADGLRELRELAGGVHLRWGHPDTRPMPGSWVYLTRYWDGSEVRGEFRFALWPWHDTARGRTRFSTASLFQYSAYPQVVSLQAPEPPVGSVSSAVPRASGTVQCRDVGTPWQMMLVVALAGWINEQQLGVIEYLKEENRVLREQLGRRRPRFTDDQRRRLAAKGKALGRRVLGERHLRRAIAEYVEHWHQERTHQGLGNRVIEGVPEPNSGRVARRERLGGILSHYYRDAA